MITRTCIICGNDFNCYPSDNKVTCSQDCRRERQRQRVLANPVKWGESAKARASAKGQTSNLKLGYVAAQHSPIAGRTEMNKEAKTWTLIDPSGNEIVVRNLLLWARKNTQLFDKPPGDHSAHQIASGFKAISQTLSGKRGVPGRPRGATTYFGWTLKCPPQKPPG